MVLLLQETGLNVIISAAIVIGYIIGISTQEEIERIAKKMKAEKIFSYPLIIAEIIIVSLALYRYSSYYIAVSSIVMLFNLCFSALYNAEKSDLQRTLSYIITFLVPSLIIGTIIIIL
ncbi:hypothetical protein M1558_00695 [Candidatus Parvarchaeota archaeon]|nr:hypothetical protein [Candidatus Parvarchaeota archaeon]